MGIGDGPMGHSDFTVVGEGSQNLDPGQDLNAGWRGLDEGEHVTFNIVV